MLGKRELPVFSIFGAIESFVLGFDDGNYKTEEKFRGGLVLVVNEIK